MKSSLLVIAFVLGAATAAAQQPVPPTQPTPARDSAGVPLDRIIAVVGDQVITQYDVQERMLALQQQPGFKPPQNQAEFGKLALEVVNQLIDEEALVQKATELKVEVTDQELNGQVDRQVRDIRSRFTSDQEFRAELQKAGLGTPEEYKRFLMDQIRRGELQRRAVAKLKQDGKLPPVSVSQADVEEAFNRSRGTLPRRPATVTFRQIVVAPKPTPAAKEAARQKAESLLAEVKGGAEFERVAKRESADSVSALQGGDLGWARRAQMVPEFERWMFALRPGDLSPVVETGHGFHIIRVDRVQPGEVKSRHILVKPKLDSADVDRARVEADSVAKKWTGGVPFDSLVKQHHDPLEETSILTPIPRDTALPPSYREAFAGKKASETVIFPIAGPGGIPKFVVAQLVTVDEGGEYTLADLKERVRQQLSEEASYRRLLDGLRKQLYVSIRAEELAGTAPKP